VVGADQDRVDLPASQVGALHNARSQVASALGIEPNGE
jgi:hypothetical protein